MPLVPKRIKINRDIPVAAIRKSVQERRRELDELEHHKVIPPITPVSRESTRIMSENEFEEQCVAMEIDQPDPVEDEEIKHDSPFRFLESLKKNPNTNEFVYLIPANVSAKKAAFCQSYDLKIVEFFEIDTGGPHGYYTMSAKVSHFLLIFRV